MALATYATHAGLLCRSDGVLFSFFFGLAPGGFFFSTWLDKFRAFQEAIVIDEPMDLFSAKSRLGFDISKTNLQSPVFFIWISEDSYFFRWKSSLFSSAPPSPNRAAGRLDGLPSFSYPPLVVSQGEDLTESCILPLRSI